MIERAIDSAAERFPPVFAAAGLGVEIVGDKLSVDAEVVIDDGFWGAGNEGMFDTPALAHTFAAALSASHPAAVIS